tara:strand:+ start:41379 stop:42221 length:843 start_codon:yes stop_codon:yes gene_type:complete
MLDTIEELEGSLVQHGETHNRLYVKECPEHNLKAFIPKIKALAQQNKYDKILGKIPENAISFFETNGYKIEAKIPGLYHGEINGYFLADYLNKNRSYKDERALKTIESVKTIAQAAKSTAEEGFMKLPSRYEVRTLGKKDLTALAQLHQRVFTSYDVPIDDEAYLTNLLKKNHQFYGLFDEGELIVSAILQINVKQSNIEIVDIATHPNFRGQNLSYYVLQEIKQKSSELGCKTLFSLVRATSYGLNITFSKHGFHLGGTLYNNTMIANRLESMNVWYCN